MATASVPSTTKMGVQWQAGGIYEGLDLRTHLFKDLRLAGSIFKNCNLRGSDFINCDLRGSDFSGSDLRGCDFHDSNIKGCELNDVISSQLDLKWLGKWITSDTRIGTPIIEIKDGKFSIHTEKIPKMYHCTQVDDNMIIGFWNASLRGIIFKFIPDGTISCSYLDSSGNECAFIARKSKD